VSRVTDDLSSGAVATTAVVGTLDFSTNGAGGFYYCTGAVWTAVGGGGAANSTAFGVDYTDAFTGTSNQLDYSAVTQNVIIATGSSGPGSNSITLPPAAANANRLISVTAAGKALLYTNADGSNTANTTTALLVSDGTIWRVLRGN
jgi:hypothetical protein